MQSSLNLPYQKLQQQTSFKQSPSLLSDKKKINTSKSSNRYSLSNIQTFINNISQDKDAFGLFKEQAIRRGILKEDSLPKLHHNYYNKYIRPNNEQSTARTFADYARKDFTKSQDKLNQSFVPIRDLLRQSKMEKVSTIIDDWSDPELSNSLMITQKARPLELPKRINPPQSLNVSSDRLIANQNKSLFSKKGQHTLSANHNHNINIKFKKIKVESFNLEEMEQAREQSIDSQMVDVHFLDIPQQKLPEIMHKRQQTLVDNTLTPLQQYKETKQQIKIKNQKLVDNLSKVISGVGQPNFETQKTLKNMNKNIIGNLIGQGAHSNEEQQNDDDQRTLSRAVSKIVKQSQFQGKQKLLTLDRKDPVIAQHFNIISVEKKLNKNKLREYLSKRYKDFLADRIMKGLSNLFNNFGVYHDLNQYCEIIENFANQDINALKYFTYKIIDINNDKKLSENDLFQLMKLCAQTNQKQDDQPPEDSDVFLEVFSADFVKVIKQINIKKQQKNGLVDAKFSVKKQETKNSIWEHISEVQDSFEEKTNSSQFKSQKNSHNPPPASQHKLQLAKSQNASQSNFHKKNQSGERHQIDDDYRAQLDMESQLMINNISSSSILNIVRQKSSYQKHKIKPVIKDESNQSKSDIYLTFMEFNQIQFKNFVPQLVIDIVYHLTGRKINPLQHQKISGSIIDNDEKLNSVTDPMKQSSYQNDSFFDPDIITVKASIMNDEFKILLSNFKRFLNLKTDDLKQNSQFKEQNVYLTENNIMDNMKNIFGYSFPYIGRLMYLYMSKGFDKSKISLSRFMTMMLPLYQDDRNFSHNKIAFKILVNYMYHENEIRYKMFGVGKLSYSGNPFQDNPDIKFQEKHLFQGLEYEGDRSFGQRGFGKNMDKNLYQLLKFYNKYYNKESKKSNAQSLNTSASQTNSGLNINSNIISTYSYSNN
ncbi:UNKNOWN [Stylonychia lemnae]|uniref:EF-hand domain-containing protein n=1 Tax=Stylonychia lemnae TaxID=5949 RepID=A0A078A0X4_STYLE|nr:UNKNOWN [Stylonychia lemnae]|eukprot:CDW75780.1 UNKNOWN [Stylonychia lemnae]